METDVSVYGYFERDINMTVTKMTNYIRPLSIKTVCQLNMRYRKSNYRNFPKYSDTQNIRTPKKFIVITLKFELYGSTIE